LLESKGYEVLEAKNGDEAVNKIREDSGIDLCIMDIMMPKTSGIAATEAIRNFSNLPILFLTAKSLDRDKELAYSAGGDDYLVKPFGTSELLMKVEALTRRYNMYSPKPQDSRQTINLGSGTLLNIERREVFKRGKQLDVRDRELEVLIFLVKNRGRVVSTDEIYSSVWCEMPLATASNTVTVHILNLRRKLEDEPSSPRIIRTVWGKGYQID
jgi:DNA-binding response OmpR family regulator